MVWIMSSEDEVQAIKEINALSDRSAAIIAAVLLDDRLGAAVAEKFPVDGETKKQLFKPSGALGSLDVRARLAYALGIISKGAFQDIETIAEIRNRFAHRLSASDFNENEIAKLSMRLKLVDRHIFPYGQSSETTPTGISPKMFVEDLPTQLADARKRYILTIALITTALHRFPQGRSDSKPPLPSVQI